MQNLIVGGIIVLIITAVIVYIVKEKRKGTKCIGCSCGSSCGSDADSEDGCSCKK